MSTSTIHMTGALEPREGWTADRCPMAHALDVVRNRSAFLILREAFYGATRFEEFAELTGAALLEREPYQEPGQRTRRAYRLTEKGSDLLPVLVALMRWGQMGAP